VRLAEILVALAVLGLTLAGTLTALESGLRAYSIGAARVESQQSARVAVERLVRDIRGAGRGPGSAAAVSVAEPGRLVLHHDLDGDGAASALGETVTWRLDGTVLRRDAGGGAQPIVRGVSGFRLDYLGADSLPTQAADRVRTVVVTLTIETGRGIERAAATFATSVRLRNR